MNTNVFLRTAAFAAALQGASATASAQTPPAPTAPASSPSASPGASGYSTLLAYLSSSRTDHVSPPAPSYFLLREALRVTGGFDDHSLFQLQNQLIATGNIRLSPRWRFIFPVEWNAGFQFWGSQSKSLSASTARGLHFPGLRPDASSGITGGLELHEGAAYHQVVIEPTVTVDALPWLTFGARLVFILNWRTDAVSTTLTGVSGDQQQQMHMGGNNCIQGDISCQQNGSRIPTPASARPGAVNQLGPYEQEVSQFGFNFRAGVTAQIKLASFLSFVAEFYFQFGSATTDSSVARRYNETASSIDPTLRLHLNATANLGRGVRLLLQPRVAFHDGPTGFDVIGGTNIQF